jgi:hypothetical protein
VSYAEAVFYENCLIPVKCTCQWRCRINPQKLGVCGMYRNQEGALFNLNYGRVSSMAADPIEKKPLFHFHPGTLCFSLGTLGCNFQCKHCQNWEISPADGGSLISSCRELLPEASIELAKTLLSGHSLTYNEPAVWFEHTLESAKLGSGTDFIPSMSLTATLPRKRWIPSALTWTRGALILKVSPTNFIKALPACRTGVKY